LSGTLLIPEAIALMATSTLLLPRWPRPNFVRGGGNPFLHFAAFGTIVLQPPLDRLTYRAAGVPSGFELLLYDRRKQPKAFEALAASQAWKLAQSESPELAAAAQSAPHFALLRGHAADPDSLDYLRDAVGIVQYLCHRGATAIFDPQTYQFWHPSDWHDRLFAPAAAVPHEHVIILETPADDDDDGTWFHTRGLRKFGRPDLSAHHVRDHHRDKITELFNHYVDYLASGGILTTGDRVTLDGLPPGGVLALDARLDHPEFLNAHLSINWPVNAGSG
jgi:hypothetical protein